MDTTFVINKEELTIDFLEKIKLLFSKSSRLHISVSDNEDFGLYSKESKLEYENRLKNAIKNVEKVSFSENEFEAMIKQNL